MSQKLIEIEIFDRKITISGEIFLKLEVANDFEYIGTQEIIIYDIAKVFHYIFGNYYVDNKQERHISKLFLLQHEYFLPGVSKHYKYDSKEIVELGGISWQRDNFVDLTSDYESEPKSDAYQLMTFMEKINFILPSKFFIDRLVTMLNKEKNQELLIIYLEKITEDQYKKVLSNGKLIVDQWEKEQINL